MQPEESDQLSRLVEIFGLLGRTLSTCCNNEQHSTHLGSRDGFTYPLLLRTSSLGLHKGKLLSHFCLMDLHEALE